MSVLILVDPLPGDAEESRVARLVGAARELPGPVALLVIDAEEGPRCQRLATLDGVSQLLRLAPAAPDQPPEPEALAEWLTARHAEHTAILAAASPFGAEIIPRVGGLLGITPLTGVVGIGPDHTFIRPTHAGAALARIRSRSALKLLTVQPWAFAPVATGTTPAPVRAVGTLAGSGLSRSLGVTTIQRPPGQPELTGARIVVAGGAGLEKGRDFQPVEALAAALGGAVGASRGAVDAGLAPADRQIGQTGHVIAPELYIGLGISGAVQHLAGIKAAGCIVSINTDPGAPLSSVADLSLVADAREAVPALIRALQA